MLKVRLCRLASGAHGGGLIGRELCKEEALRHDAAVVLIVEGERAAERGDGGVVRRCERLVAHAAQAEDKVRHER